MFMCMSIYHFNLIIKWIIECTYLWLYYGQTDNNRSAFIAFGFLCCINWRNACTVMDQMLNEK